MTACFTINATMTELFVFVSATLVIAWLSRASLLKPGAHGYAHGFYRFIAWELMLFMLVLNMSVWYVEPQAPHQIAAGICMFTSLLLVVSGFALLRLMGKTDSNRDDTPMMGIEKTTALVTRGIYRYIRHPIYGSLIFLDWGIFFKQPTISETLIALSATAFLIATARVEENENIRYFGDAYREYMKHTKMFVPFVV